MFVMFVIRLPVSSSKALIEQKLCIKIISKFQPIIINVSDEILPNTEDIFSNAIYLGSGVNGNPEIYWDLISFYILGVDQVFIVSKS